MTHMGVIGFLITNGAWPTSIGQTDLGTVHARLGRLIFTAFGYPG